ARALGLLHEVIQKNHQLASSDPPAGEVTLNDALEGTLQVAKHDHLVILVSDFDGADEETRRLATRLAAHNDVLAVLVYDPLGASLRGRPGMRAMDRGEHWEIPPGRDFSQSFQQEFSDLLDQWREIFRALKVPMLPISTDQPVAAQIRGLFGETGPT
ncbi:MAG: DUF58 domain-containing protein, partial [Verrucomicrobiae bacterium]|nr:DUF58 domain-containing protein [Verrucomicrobiae bacterium]